MSTIYKYPVGDVGEVFELEMPQGAQILDVQLQDGKPVMWALVDEKAPLDRRLFMIYGTGWALPGAYGQYVATFQTPPFVWHLFEVTNA